jgi:lysophospholipase L1-like esterase
MGAATTLAACGGVDANAAAKTSAGGSAGSGGSNGGSGSNASGGAAGSSAVDPGSGGNAPLDSCGDPNPAASAAYNPCPTDGTPCVIMALGDSITDGFGGSGSAGSYRPRLFKLALDHGQNITYVGSQTNGPEWVAGPDGGMVPYPKGHEGHSGFTIDDGGGRTGIHSLTAPAMIKYHPNIITLMIGTNDVDINLDLRNAPRRLRGLIDTIVATDPKVLIALAQIIPTTDDAQNVRVKTYNDAMPDMVKACADAGKHIVLVDMYGAFMENDMFKTQYMHDKLHPNDTGYTKMGEVWYAALGSLFR